MRAHQHAQLDVAERLYRQLLRLYPAQPDVLHYLGVLQHQRGHSDEAVTLIGKALAVAPNYPDAHNNLGNVHKECGRLAEAEACYRRALARTPDHHNARANLAVVLEAQGRVAESLAVWDELQERAPNYAHGQWMRGRALRDNAACVEDVERAVGCFRRALELDPGELNVLQDLGVTLYALKRPEEACEVYRDWSARDPANPVPRHMLAACGGAPTPARADDAYVQETFDQFAASFDQQLLQYLDYRAPQVLAEALKAVLPSATDNLDILDAGCGTGLCEPLLRPLAHHLAGVDLSPGMLDRARARGGYDELVAGELTAYLVQHADAWDVIVSADTLVYFGDIREVCAAAHAALHAGGWFVFSLEAMEGDGFELGPSGRYRHSRHYAETILRETGFADVTVRTDSLRKEVGQPVASWVVVARAGSTKAEA